MQAYPKNSVQFGFYLKGLVKAQSASVLKNDVSRHAGTRRNEHTFQEAPRRKNKGAQLAKARPHERARALFSYLPRLARFTIVAFIWETTSCF